MRLVAEACWSWPTRTTRCVPSPTTALSEPTSTRPSRRSAGRSQRRVRRPPAARPPVSPARQPDRGARRLRSFVSERSFGGVELTRAAPAAAPGVLDELLYDLVESRFRAVAESEPTWATQLGIHAWDDRLADPTRERILGDIERDRAHIATLEALDAAALSAEARFERELELHHVRLRVFRAETIRNWERRSTGASALGDALFPLFTRD